MADKIRLQDCPECMPDCDHKTNCLDKWHHPECPQCFCLVDQEGFCFGGCSCGDCCPPANPDVGCIGAKTND